MRISPLFVGRSHRSSAATAFLAVVIGGWFWGIAGSLMAMPTLLAVVIVLSHQPEGAGLARLLSAGERGRAGAV